MMETIFTHAPALLIALPLLAGFTMPIIGKAGPTVRAIWAVILMAATSAIGLTVAWTVFNGVPWVYAFGASAPGEGLSGPGGFPIRIIFAIDGMSALMTVIVSIVGFAVVLYATMSESRQSGLDGFYSLLFLLVAGVLGMVNTGDLFNFFVFLEISSLAGAALVSFRIDKGVAVEAALKYALISTVGSLCVLMAAGLLIGQYNTLNIAELAQRIQFTRLDKIALALLIVPLAMKCGSVPMHFWTPDSYAAAPSSITAFLVVSSQASLYGMFRILFTLFHVALGVSTLGWIVVGLGVLSMFVGVTMAIPQKDVKRLMAYHAVSQTGYMLLGIGVGLAVMGNAGALASYGKMAMAGGIFHIINHAMYKGLLFMTAGAVFYRCGTRNLNRLGGLGHTMKWTMLFFVIGALAIAGIPPFNGFASKLMIYESVFAFNPFIAIVAMVVSILTLASFVKVFHSMFMGPRLPALGEVKEAPLPMLIGMGILAVGVVAFGIMPEAVVRTIIDPAVNALIDHQQYIMTVLGGTP
jgi:multicomponent Na+:H+ antiporter subunit D